MDCDNLFLVILTGISFMILAIDFKVLEKMFQEYFKLKYYLPEETYYDCYKPQAEMRIVFECYAIYSALICTLLTLVLALGFSDFYLEKVARKVINLSFLLYGPVLMTVCLYGFNDIKALSKICTLHGISNHTNYVSLFVLFSCFFFSVACSFTIAIEKSLDVAN